MVVFSFSRFIVYSVVMKFIVFYMWIGGKVVIIFSLLCLSVL